jgi:hypothetical protein
MNSFAERKMHTRQWRLFLGEVRRRWAARGIDVPELADLNELILFLQRSAALSEFRSKKEAEELVQSFAETLQRAA